MKTPLSLALMLCALSPFHALASAPFRTANCDPQNPLHIAAKEAMRRAALNPNSDDFTCWVYVAAVQDDAQGESEWASILVMNKQWDEAFAWSEKSARQDNPDGAWILSELYRTGRGTQMNLERAQYWRTTALKDPSVRARAGIKDGAATAPPAATATCNPNNHSASGYREGLKKAVAENKPSDAICWVYIGATQGDASSEGLYGEFLLLGRGVPMNPSEAFVWSKKSADQGNLRAAFIVGYMYSQGLGTPRDMAKANYWVEKASKDPEVARSLQAGRESAGQTRHVDGVNEMLPKTEAGQTQLIMTLIKALDKGPSPHDACEQRRSDYERRFHIDNCPAQDPTWYDQK